ncbi:MAG: response regulator transcription factor [Anaerolineae bacterium]|nr:response regulator transcription factor [Anaerolineae bacterium]
MLVLVLAKPGPLRDSLVTLAMAIPQVEAVSQAENATVALRMIESQRPALVILDMTFLEAEGWGALLKLWAAHPKTRWVMLVDDVQQQAQVQAAGVHTALLKGVPAIRLSTTIESLLF